jgi:hypothetical protein
MASEVAIKDINVVPNMKLKATIKETTAFVLFVRITSRLHQTTAISN